MSFIFYISRNKISIYKKHILIIVQTAIYVSHVTFKANRIQLARRLKAMEECSKNLRSGLDDAEDASDTGSSSS